jgi:hypothetical protein
MDDILELFSCHVMSDTVNYDTRTIKIDAIDDVLAADDVRQIVSHPKFVGMGVDRNGALCLYFSLG